MSNGSNEPQCSLSGLQSDGKQTCIGELADLSDLSRVVQLFRIGHSTP